ncbi:MAG TPA: hypothetical protein VF520_04055 [Thermoleophilaceae bacterium]
MERRGWVTSAEERNRVEADLSGMAGHGLAGVRYVGMSDEGAPTWDVGTFHSIDYGLEIELEDRTTWSIAWDQAGHNEAILVYAGTLSSQFSPDAEVAVWDVTSVWRQRFPEGFTEVECVWTRHVYGPAYTGVRWEIRVDDGGVSDLCLLSLVLTGARGGQAVVTLGGEDHDAAGRFAAFHDNVAVFFSLEEARRVGVLLPGDPDATVR